MLKSVNPTTTKAWKALLKHSKKIKKVHLSQVFSEDESRFSKYSAEFGETLLLDYSKNLVTEETMELLNSLARECELADAIKKLFSGDKINQTEGRSVLHTALRNRSGKNQLPEVHRVLERIKSFADKISRSEMLGYSEEAITDIVNIGIGGSDLGPHMAYEALSSFHKPHIKVHFVSNIDGTHIYETLKKIKPETTLFIVTSKTFTTQETITNANTARKWFLDKAINEAHIGKHFVGVTANTRAAEDFGISADHIFEFWDWVGGRHSLCSAVGLTLACSIGYENFEKMLDGFHAMDKHFLETEFEKNIPVILALLSVWYGNFFAAQTEAVLPYDQKLNKFVSYLQQCSMESNGKSVDRNGDAVDYQTGMILWGDVGTNNQHSFFQLLHQGTIMIPCDFLVAVKSQSHFLDHHLKLLANFLAQTEALAFGNAQEHDFAAQPYRYFSGNRPSNSILYKELTPFTLGSLIAMYEHKVFVQGIIWNIFSFDQWGVELGKKLAEKILLELQSKSSSNGHDVSTNSLINFLTQSTKK